MATSKKPRQSATPPPGKRLTGRGGPGRGQGRKPGVSKAKKPSLAAAQRIAQGVLLIAENGGALPRAATPLDVMVEAMRVAYRLGGALAAFPYAKECAPFIHAKISSITLTPPAPKPPTPDHDVPLVEFVDVDDAEAREMLGLQPIDDAIIKEPKP